MSEVSPALYVPLRQSPHPHAVIAHQSATRPGHVSATEARRIPVGLSPIRAAACAAALAFVLGLAAGPGAASAAACANADADVGQTDRVPLETAAICLINEERTSRGLRAVASDGILEHVALDHSRDMRDRNFFSHVNPDGQDAGDRARAAGYRDSVLETLSRGTQTPGQTVDLWMGSAIHRKIILDPDHRGIGAGVADALWTLVFGGQPVSGPANESGDGSTAGAAQGGGTFPAKFEVHRATVEGGRLDMLVDTTARAQDDTVRISFIANGRRSSFTERISSANRLRFDRTLPKGQRGVSTGIVELDYAGNEQVRPEFVRLRAARGHAQLERNHLSLQDGVLSARGTVTSRARGAVRLILGFVRDDGSVGFWHGRAAIDAGRWETTQQLPVEAAHGGHLSIQFTGYLPQRIRGEQIAKELLAGQLFE